MYPYILLLHWYDLSKRDATLTNFSFRKWRSGVITHKSRKIVGHRKTSLALSQEIFESLICFFGGAETGKLAHGPKLAAIAGRVNTSCVRELAREGDVAIQIDVGNVRGTVKAVDLFERNSLETGFALALTLESRFQGFFFPAFFGLVFRRGFFDLLHRAGSFDERRRSRRL